MKHIAIFTDEIIQKIFSGKKTVDSRFSVKKIPPYGVIQTGDIVYIKKSGGSIVGQFLAKQVITFDHLTPEMMDTIKRVFGTKIKADRYFWNEKREAVYGTLIFIDEVQPCLFPMQIIKSDRRPWILYKEVAA